MVNIYVLYIRSVLEQSAVVWTSSIAKGEQLDIKRVQKCALRIILKEDYTCYQDALKFCNLITLKERRTNLCLSFAVKCTKNPNTSDIFPLKQKLVFTRPHEKYEVKTAKTDRLANSAVPFMQRLLNKYEKEKKTKSK